MTSVLTAFLSVRDIPCPRCDYNLRNVRSGRCPECGARLEVRIGSDDLKLGPWVSAVVATSLSLGFFAFIGLFAAAGAMAGGFGTRREWITLIVCWASVAGMAGATLVLVRKRHRFLACRRRVQWLLVLTAIGVDALLLAAFLVSYVLA